MYALQAKYWRILYRVEQDMEDMHAVQARYLRILYRVEQIWRICTEKNNSNI